MKNMKSMKFYFNEKHSCDSFSFVPFVFCCFYCHATSCMTYGLINSSPVHGYPANSRGVTMPPNHPTSQPAPRYPPTAFSMETMGMNSATTMKPTIRPRTMTITGSSMETMPETMTSISSS